MKPKKKKDGTWVWPDGSIGEASGEVRRKRERVMLRKLREDGAREIGPDEYFLADILAEQRAALFALYKADPEKFRKRYPVMDLEYPVMDLKSPQKRKGKKDPGGFHRERLPPSYSDLITPYVLQTWKVCSARYAIRSCRFGRETRDGATVRLYATITGKKKPRYKFALDDLIYFGLRLENARINDERRKAYEDKVANMPDP